MSKVIDIIHPAQAHDATRPNEIHESIIWLTKILDDAFEIPGTNVRFGVDALIGLIPGIGDVISAAIGYLLIQEAKRLGASRWVRARMAANLLIDGVVGAVPLVGDMFDVAFKANRKNLRLLQEHLDKRRRPFEGYLNK